MSSVGLQYACLKQWKLALGLNLSIMANLQVVLTGNSSQFTLEMCTAAKNCEKFTKTPILWVQGRSRSSMLIKLKSPWPVLLLPAYPGFIVIKIPTRWSSGISEFSKVNTEAFIVSAFLMVVSCVETTERTEMSIRLNSSKQPQAPHWQRPEKILPITL